MLHEIGWVIVKSKSLELSNNIVQKSIIFLRYEDNFFLSTDTKGDIVSRIAMLSETLKRVPNNRIYKK